MPVFMVDGQQYRIPSKAQFTGNKDICEQAMAKQTATQATRATTSRSTRQSPENNLDREWTAREDRLLRELIAFRVPWRRIAVTLGQRTMDDVQTRWRQIRGQSGQTGQTGKTEKKEEEDKGISTRRATPAKPQRHVSFAEPLVTGGDNDDNDDNDADSGDPPGDTHIKKVFYIDEDFSLEEVVLLHNIAAKWERDRWLAISTRFNDLTQRTITPEQACSVVGES